MRWEKLGHIFAAKGNLSWMQSYAMVPIPERIGDYLYRIYFTCRDEQNRGHGAYLEIDIRQPTKVLGISNNPILSPGELGCFDDSGIILSSIIDAGGIKNLYYVGINLGVTVPFRNSIGLAIWNEQAGHFERVFKGPIIERNKQFSHFIAAIDVCREDNLFRSWFTSCQKWEHFEKDVRHYYRIEYAESLNGIDWQRTGKIAIDFRDEYEYAIAAPRVIKENNQYQMWFSSRGTADTPTYRIRHATSDDGINWIRTADKDIGIDVSEEGWDSEMVCYPYVFKHESNIYMLYNGNGYGKTGFGIAKLIS